MTDKVPAQAKVKQDGRTDGAQKKPYRTPVLTTYGHISKLTMSGAGSGTDSKVAMMMVCL